MDNAPIHRTELLQVPIETCGAELLYLPPYSPEFHLIEHDFANIKRLRNYKTDIPLNEVLNMYQNN